MDGIRITLASEAETRNFAEALAPSLMPGDILLLDGPVGAGKTFLARALIQARLSAAGVHEDVPSPTFTLVQTYTDGICEVWHADLYRLSGPADIAELGLDDAFEAAICIVEWPDRLGGMTPDDALTLKFEIGAGETERHVEATGPGDWPSRLSQIQSVALAG